MVGLLGSSRDERFQLLPSGFSAMAQAGIPRPAAPAAPAPSRQRGEPGLLTYLMGGRQGLASEREFRDAERARLQAEADRPQMMARQNQLRQAAEQMGPAAMLAFDLNPEKFGENLAQQYSPQVIGIGGVQSLIGTGQRVSAPRDMQFGDSLVRLDPLSPTPQTLATRGPTISEGIQMTAGERQAAADRSREDIARAELGLRREQFESDAEFRARQIEAQEEQARLTRDAVTPADSDDIAAIEGFRANNERFNVLLSSIRGDPESGVRPAFNLSPLAAAGYRTALATGIGMTPEAAAYGNYVSEVEALVSAGLRLNVGPQTDKDAERETRALLSNIDNLDYVLERLPVVIENNNRMITARENAMRQRRPAGSTQGGPSQQDRSRRGGGQPAPTGQGRLTPDQAARLPVGTRFIGTDGVERVRQ